MAYVAVVQDRPPILRAGLVAVFYLCARPLFRRVEMLNTVALAALAILFVKPSSLADPSFELSFLAAGVIAGLALPWMERTSVPYREGLRHLGDTTRDAGHPPRGRAVPDRNARGGAQWLAARLPERLAPRASALVTLLVRAGLRLWEIVLLSAVIQWGMMPAAGAGFSPREPFRASHQHSRGDLDRADRAAGLSDARGHIRVGAAGRGAGKNARVLRGAAARHRRMVQPPAARLLSDPGVARVAGGGVFRGVYSAGGGCARGGGAAKTDEAPGAACRRPSPGWSG